jgi:hypothetical protein
LQQKVVLTLLQLQQEVLLKPLAIAMVCTLTIPCSCSGKVYFPSRDHCVAKKTVLDAFDGQ